MSEQPMRIHEGGGFDPSDCQQVVCDSCDFGAVGLSEWVDWRARQHEGENPGHCVHVTRRAEDRGDGARLWPVDGVSG